MASNVEYQTMYVGNLKEIDNLSENLLTKFFQDNGCSSVKNINIMKNLKNEILGYAFVDVSDIEAPFAIDMNGKNWPNTEISLIVNFAQKKKGRQRSKSMSRRNSSSRRRSKSKSNKSNKSNNNNNNKRGVRKRKQVWLPKNFESIKPATEEQGQTLEEIMAEVSIDTSVPVTDILKDLSTSIEVRRDVDELVQDLNDGVPQNL